MLCPTCSSPLASGRAEGGFVTTCPGCFGIGCDRTFLRHACGDGLAAWYAARKSDAAKTDRKCPFCSRGLFAFSPVELCKSCRFAWLDRAAHGLPGHASDVTQAAALARRILGSAVQGAAKVATPVATKVLRYVYRILLWIPASLGFPVEHGVKPVKTKPVVTGVLFFAILGSSAFAFLDLPYATRAFGLNPARLWDLWGLNFVSNFFVHENWMHLFGNVYFFAIFGDNVEDYLKRWRYVALFFLAGIVGNVAHCLWDVRTVIGASGAISGVIAFYALQFPRAKLGRSFFGKVLVLQFPAWLGLILWLGLQGSILLQQLDRTTGVSALAHLGGVLVGVIFRVIFR